MTQYKNIVFTPVKVKGSPWPGEMEGKGVRGRYVSVEHLQEIEGGKVIWQMATSSNPGGNIPPLLAEATIPSQIAAVRVPLLFFIMNILILDLHLKF